MYTAHEEAIGKYTIKIMPDNMNESPREWGSLGTMVCWHSRYNLGDKHDFDTPGEFIDEAKAENHIVLPLYLYDHSGITMNTTGFSCQWDSGQVGFIYVSREKVRKEYNWKRITKKRLARIREYLQGEVSVYDQYLRGEVYYYIIEGGEGEHIDSCSGFYGLDYCIGEARNMVQFHIDHGKQLTQRGE